MERIISDEDKIKRAIEISKRRNNTNYSYRTAATTRVNVNEKKDYKLFKRMILQIVICLLIYLIFHLITSTNYAFSADFIKNTNNILNYDVNFQELYNNLMVYITSKTEENTNIELNNIENDNTINNTQIVQNNAIQNTLINQATNSAVPENEGQENKSSESKQEVKDEKQQGESKVEETAMTQMEQDAETVAKLCKFQKPISGTITSEFGDREATIKGMTTNHKGIDIAANSGTNIKAAMAGKVTVAEENSEYGKFIKIVNGDVMTVYAHCKSLKVKVGDKVKIGQTIATVGSTGTSTGPHLHLEIRYKDRYINPRLLIEF